MAMRGSLDRFLEDGHDPRILANGDDLICFYLCESLNLLGRWPFDFNEIGKVRVAKPEMKAEIVLGHHACSAVHLIYL